METITPSPINEYDIHQQMIDYKGVINLRFNDLHDILAKNNLQTSLIQTSCSNIDTAFLLYINKNKDEFSNIHKESILQKKKNKKIHELYNIILSDYAKHSSDYIEHKTRVNDIITSIQIRIENIENAKEPDTSFTKKINSIEKRFNTINLKIQQLETIINNIERDKTIITDKLDTKLSTIIKTCDKRDEKYDCKLLNITNKIDMLSNIPQTNNNDIIIKKINDINKILSQKNNSKIHKSDIDTIKAVLKEELRTELKEELRTELKEELKIDTKSELNDIIMMIQNMNKIISTNPINDRVLNLENQICCMMSMFHGMVDPSCKN